MRAFDVEDFLGADECLETQSLISDNKSLKTVRDLNDQ